ncbi:phenylalanine--tRNA ligase subunit beta [Terrimonas sp. NA20]|uniref:Phenylalanine--tRNA ligase beta subunit n=1 Tax=Terrimonas ginsenosidimutans TaxID=2908004 RepID=A0ABS9KVZ2_9BACT|nr:phenylalanine--tRNA ligase subunit beta [Terrimonas ginsenosidimutans]MCG2616427.1 phenylalanine--tRNA ligase subunit beta [Terrimonas ginsenosidimutans]
MTISYKWLSEYLPVTVEPERLSRILTSIGLEVESLHKYEEAKGGLKGLVIGEVIHTEKHPNADKLTLTKVNIGGAEPLSIVCGAPNVATGQKVVVAPVGTTIYPTSGEPLTMKLAKIRGSESMGMICAEDEIGLGDSHAGILVLPADLKPGTPAADYFKPYDDFIYEIGLTPNRMDAMSHWGVARDVCAYLSHHDKKDLKPKLPNSNGFKTDNTSLKIQVKVENEKACPRYSGVSIANVKIGESPKWLQQRLKSIGLRPINNIVDITNFIQHETGQPLHAFDADKIGGQTVIVKNLPEGTPFVTLDEKERKLSSEDLMICDDKEGMCIAGVFGGLHSGVTSDTKNIFLESACFDGITIRKTSFRHGLRTDAATRFEKGTDISATVNVLKRAANLIKEICGGEIASEVIDLYADKLEKVQVAIKYHYLKKLSGKNYHPDTVKGILGSLGFEIVKEGIDELRVAVPYHKPDISLPADLVEEVLRIDGLDNVDIPDAITITPSTEDHYAASVYREKAANYLTGLGFFEIMTNSITNSAYFSDAELEGSVKMLNNLSAELNILRPFMLETGLEAISHNLNRRNYDLRFFEYGKTYHTTGSGKYTEPEHLCLYITGKNQEDSWRGKGTAADFYVIKGAVNNLLHLLGIQSLDWQLLDHPKFEAGLQGSLNGQVVVQAGAVHKQSLTRFDIKQPVFFADLNWDILSRSAAAFKPAFKAIPKFPAVQRDLAIVVGRQLTYGEVEKAVEKIKLNKLQEVNLFDIFESDKLGTDKKSMAISFTFLDEEKTLTDKEIDGWMSKIMTTLEKELQAEIRK